MNTILYYFIIYILKIIFIFYFKIYFCNLIIKIKKNTMNAHCRNLAFLSVTPLQAVNIFRIF